MKRSPINPIGKKRRKDMEEMDAVRDIVLDRGCEFGVYAARSKTPATSCRGRRVAHHRQRRSQGGDNSTANLACLCDFHHQWVHDHPAAAMDMGLIL